MPPLFCPEIPMSLDEFFIFLQRELVAFHTAYSAKVKQDPDNYPTVLPLLDDWQDQLTAYIESKND